MSRERKALVKEIIVGIVILLLCCGLASFAGTISSTPSVTGGLLGTDKVPLGRPAGSQSGEALTATLSQINDYVQTQISTAGGTVGVSSVFTRTGDITAQTGDYTGAQITQDSTHRFATDAEKSVWNSAVPSTRTVNSKALSANITITASDVGFSNATTLARFGAGPTYNGSAIGGSSTLDALTDVTVPTPAFDQFLYYNGSAWVNGTPQRFTNLSTQTRDAGRLLTGTIPAARVPTLNQNTTGTASGLTSQYVDWNSSSGGSSIANKPSLFDAARFTSLSTNTRSATRLVTGTMPIGRLPTHAFQHYTTGGADRIPDATTSKRGLMSAPDKTNLDNAVQRLTTTLDASAYGFKADLFVNMSGATVTIGNPNITINQNNCTTAWVGKKVTVLNGLNNGTITGCTGTNIITTDTNAAASVSDAQWYSGSNNAAALAAMLAAVPDGGAVLKFANGTYLMPGKIALSNKNISIKGDGIASTLLVQDIWVTGGWGTPGIEITNSDENYVTEIKDLTLATLIPPTAGAIGIKYTNTNPVFSRNIPNLTIENVSLNWNIKANWWDTGIQVNNAIQPIFNRVFMYANNTDAATWATGARAFIELLAPTIHMTTPYVINCQAVGVYYAIKSNGYIEGLHAVNNQFYWVREGIHASDDDTAGFYHREPQVFVLNTHINAFEYGVYLKNVSDADISHNLLFTQPKSGSTAYSIYTTYENGGIPANVNISDNQFWHQNGAAGTMYAAYLNKGLGYSVHNNTMKLASGDTGIYIYTATATVGGNNMTGATAEKLYTGAFATFATDVNTGTYGGKTLIGGNQADDDLIVQGTSGNATSTGQGNIIFKTGNAGATTAGLIDFDGKMKLGGTGTPDAQLHIQNTANSATLTMDTSATGGGVNTLTAKKSLASGGALTVNDPIFQFNIQGATAANTYDTARGFFHAVAAENWSNTSGGWDVYIRTRMKSAAALGAPTERIRFTSRGPVKFANMTSGYPTFKSYTCNASHRGEMYISASGVEDEMRLCVKTSAAGAYAWKKVTLAVIPAIGVPGFGIWAGIRRRKELREYWAKVLNGR